MDMTNYQANVAAWTHKIFGSAVATDVPTRCYRFIEEALELVQALGTTKEQVLQMVDYTYGRPVGEAYQEVGGVAVTLAALCAAIKLEMDNCAMKELIRCQRPEVIAKIQAKQATKPHASPLPGTAKLYEPEGSNVHAEIKLKLTYMDSTGAKTPHFDFFNVWTGWCGAGIVAPGASMEQNRTLDDCIDVTLKVPDEATYKAIRSRIGNNQVLRTAYNRANPDAQMAQAEPHVLYTDADENKPEQILDRNGQVALGLCKKCGRAEIELEEPCLPRPVAKPQEVGTIGHERVPGMSPAFAAPYGGLVQTPGRAGWVPGDFVLRMMWPMVAGATDPIIQWNILVNDWPLELLVCIEITRTHSADDNMFTVCIVCDDKATADAIAGRVRGHAWLEAGYQRSISTNTEANNAPKSAEYYRREKNGGFDFIPAMHPDQDYASAMTRIGRGVQHLEESLPNRQRQRTIHAFNDVQSGCFMMVAWMKRHGLN